MRAAHPRHRSECTHLRHEEWGWVGYFYSGYDQQWAAAHNWSSFPDRAAHGGAEYIPWLVSHMHGLLDVVTVHY